MNLGLPSTAIQHHYAHVASCMAENELNGRVLGVSWDGTGYGPDGTIWGGEFLLTDATSFTRVASFKQFRLPGGDKAIKEPRRTALGVLYELFGDAVFRRDDLYPLQSFSSKELRVLRQMLASGVHSPRTTSAGRLFDAAASLVGVRQRATFEGQAAMELEFSLCEEQSDDVYPYQLSKANGGDSSHHQPGIVVDWSGLMYGLVDDLSAGATISQMSLRFHNTLSEVIVDVARTIGEQRVVLTGGCFQNKYLTERTITRLSDSGFRPYWHQRVPPNDGGIALGQVYAHMRGRNSVPRMNTPADFESTMHNQ
jgi:hydrogenase maturation protein HypF